MISAIVAKNFQVDDALPSFSNKRSASNAASDLIKMLSRGGFCFAKFTSTVPSQRGSTHD